ncbi:MAG: hypothetical protein JXR60_06700 [Bacteroidales bacterium]|nr:hypothetical protein [Bacteroidales bacterium]
MSVFTLSAQSSTDIDNLYQGNDQKYYDKQTGKLYSGVAYNKYDNGQIGMKGNIKLGVFDGLWTWWYEDGAKKRETTYKDGLKEGYSYWWHKNGIKKAEIRFNGDKNIEQKRWDEKGNRLPNPKLGRG